MGTTVRTGRMSTMEKSLDVDVPVQRAYNQWTQFESFSAVHGRGGLRHRDAPGAGAAGPIDAMRSDPTGP
jgi:hypothetical protein